MGVCECVHDVLNERSYRSPGCMQSYEMNTSDTDSCQCRVRCISLTVYIELGRLLNNDLAAETIWRRMAGPLTCDGKEGFQTIDCSLIDSCTCRGAEELIGNLSQYSPYSGRDSNRARREHESRALPLDELV
jgi:hypothetical protein